MQMRKEMSSDKFMGRCVIPSCGKTMVEWEHCWEYSGKQINEKWAIVPLCYEHHRGAKSSAKIKNYCRYVSVFRASSEELKKIPKKRLATNKNIFSKALCR